MKFKSLNKSNMRILSMAGPERLLFAPAAFFILLGLMAVIAPRFVLFLVASFFLFVGLLAAVLAWKFVKMRRKFETLVKDLNGKVVVQSANRHPFDFEDEVVEESKKKILYH